MQTHVPLISSSSTQTPLFADIADAIEFHRAAKQLEMISARALQTMSNLSELPVVKKNGRHGRHNQHSNYTKQGGSSKKSMFVHRKPYIPKKFRRQIYLHVKHRFSRHVSRQQHIPKHIMENQYTRFNKNRYSKRQRYYRKKSINKQQDVAVELDLEEQRKRLARKLRFGDEKEQDEKAKGTSELTK
jgi:hypothetical protein